MLNKTGADKYFFLAQYCFQGMNQKPIKTSYWEKTHVIKNHHVLTLFDLLCVLVEHDR